MIYVIQEKDSNNYKIGFTEGKPEERLKALQTGNSSELQLFGTIEGDLEKEKEIHRELYSRRIRQNGEWFLFSKEEVVKFILSEGGALHQDIYLSRELERYKKSIEVMVLELAEKKEKIEQLEQQVKKSVGQTLKDIFENENLKQCQLQSKSCLPIVFFLYLNSDEDKTYKISSEKLAKKIGATKPSVDRAIKILEEYKVLHKYSLKNQASVYKILL